MKLLHLASFNSTNIGNGALVFGTERVLREDIDRNLEFVHEAWDDYTFELKKFDEKFVDLVNGFDGLLVNGAVSFYGRPYLVNNGFRFDLPLDLVKKIKKPIIFYGLSYRVWPGQKYHNLDKLKKSISYFLSEPRVFFGVRNDGTKEWLESMLGYESQKIIEVPDPGLYVPTKDSFHPELSQSKKNIIISLNNEDDVYRFGGVLRKIFWSVLSPLFKEKKLIALWRCIPKWDRRRVKFLKELAVAMERLVQKWDLNIILCPHYFDDYEIMSDFLSCFSKDVKNIKILHQVIVSSGLLRVDQTQYFYDLYSKIDLALSMRVHSISPSIGLGTPVIPLVSQVRISDFLSKIGLNGLGINIFGNKIADKIFDLADSILINNKPIKDKLKNSVSFMREKNAECNSKIAKLFQ